MSLNSTANPRGHVSAETLLRSWVLDRAGQHAGWVADSLGALASGDSAERDLHIFLGLAPRRLGKADLALDGPALTAADAARPGWRPSRWSVDGAARVLALLVYRSARPFPMLMKDLRRTADLAEFVALARGLPLYPDPPSLLEEADAALRSNVKPVFEAVAHDNPYPAETFDDHRWNQMILKALFVEASLAPVIGLDARATPALARILMDYAEERWAAGRPTPDDLWRCVHPFGDDPVIAAALERARDAGRLKETPS